MFVWHLVIKEPWMCLLSPLVLGSDFPALYSVHPAQDAVWRRHSTATGPARQMLEEFLVQNTQRLNRRAQRVGWFQHLHQYLCPSSLVASADVWRACSSGSLYLKCLWSACSLILALCVCVCALPGSPHLECVCVGMFFWLEKDTSSQVWSKQVTQHCSLGGWVDPNICKWSSI